MIFWLYNVQEFYVSGTMRCPSGVTVRELREACDYFLIPFTAATVKCNNLRTPFPLNSLLMLQSQDHHPVCTECIVERLPMGTKYSINAPSCSFCCFFFCTQVLMRIYIVRASGSCALG